MRTIDNIKNQQTQTKDETGRLVGQGRRTECGDRIPATKTIRLCGDCSKAWADGMADGKGCGTLLEGKRA